LIDDRRRIIYIDDVLFLETSSNPKLERPYFEVPVSQFLETKLTKTEKDSNNLFNNKSNMFVSIDIKKIKLMVERIWKQSATRLPDTPVVVETLTKIENHKKVVCKLIYKLTNTKIKLIILINFY
jgi:hypothetical protein